jgi:hypothetical protein
MENNGINPVWIHLDTKPAAKERYFIPWGEFMELLEVLLGGIGLFLIGCLTGYTIADQNRERDELLWSRTPRETD